MLIVLSTIELNHIAIYRDRDCIELLSEMSNIAKIECKDSEAFHTPFTIFVGKSITKKAISTLHLLSF